MLVYVKTSQEMGRGLYAAQDLKAGQLIMVCELLVLSEIDTIKVNETDLKYYTFKYNDKQDCLVLGLGEIFNHDDNAQCSYKLHTSDGRQKMFFILNKDVKQHDQIFINYNEDIQVDTQKYNVNLV